MFERAIPTGVGALLRARGVAQFSADDVAGHPGPVRSLIIGGILLIAAIVLSTGCLVNTFRDRAINGATRELENTALLLARQFDQQIMDWQMIAKDIVAHARNEGIQTPARFRERMSSEALQKTIASKIAAMPYVGGVNIFDAAGRLINSSQSWPAPVVEIVDRAYFRELSSNNSTSDMIVQAVHSKITRAWTIIFAQRVTSPDGQFLGIVTRGIEPSNLEGFFDTLALGDDSTIALFHADGTLLARSPRNDTMIGRDFSKGPMFHDLLRISRHGVLRFESSIDGRDRLGAARRLEGFPLAIIVTTTVSAALRDWSEQVKIILTAACLASSVIAFLLFLIIRRLSSFHVAQQQRLAVEKSRLDTAINNISLGLLLFDSSNCLVMTNRKYLEMFRLTASRVQMGQPFRDLVEYLKQSGTLQEGVKEYCDRMLGHAQTGGSFQSETLDGRTIEVDVHPVRGGGWVSTHEDITARRSSEERICYLAQYDALTDLPNRETFRQHLDHLLRSLGQVPEVAVLYLDLDNFKDVNDTLGHRVGDELLKSTAGRLRACVGQKGFVARLGGDEFAVIVWKSVDRLSIELLLSRIYDVLRVPVDCLGHHVTADASIGVAIAPDDGVEIEQLLRCADLAMYAAKEQGRTHRYFAAEMETRLLLRRELEEELRRAICDGTLDVHYQPLMDVENGQSVSCEALVRWFHPSRGTISPAQFIPIAEDAGLIDQLGTYVLTTACVEASRWPSHISLAVNVSPLQFRQQTFALKVASALANSGLSPSRLILEVTEAVVMSEDALAMLHTLRANGIRIALDDFGTGYSSLSYLQRFPFDEIKIDKSFVEKIDECELSFSLVDAVVRIAATRSMITVAEGVETKGQLAQLRKLGCDQIQGYLFSRPQQARDMLTFLASPSTMQAAGP